MPLDFAKMREHGGGFVAFPYQLLNKLAGMKLRVYLALLHRSKDKRFSVAGLRYIAKDTGKDKTSVRRTLQDLERDGHIFQIPETTPSGKPNPKPSRIRKTYKLNPATPHDTPPKVYRLDLTWKFVQTKNAMTEQERLSDRVEQIRQTFWPTTNDTEKGPVWDNQTDTYFGFSQTYMSENFTQRTDFDFLNVDLIRPVLEGNTPENISKEDLNSLEFFIASGIRFRNTRPDFHRLIVSMFDVWEIVHDFPRTPEPTPVEPGPEQIEKTRLEQLKEQVEKIDRNEGPYTDEYQDMVEELRELDKNTS